ncbi:MAG: hypothetical protein U5N58_00335 [Actinomycetota bacterium]|nr:hypothetical protein [Actinomycetota bacterium]
MDALEIVDKIEELVEKSKKLPFSSNAIINENGIYDLIDELRSLFRKN